MSIFLKPKVRNGTVYVIEASGPRMYELPGAYVSLFKHNPKKVELAPTLEAVEEVSAWCKDNNISLKTHYALEEWRLEERERRERKIVGISGYMKYHDLYDYQQKGLMFAGSNYLYNGDRLRMLIADDPRLGKSPQALAAVSWATKRDSEFKNLLILCPKALRYQWKEYVEKWFDGLYDIEVLEGTVPERMQQMNDALAAARVSYNSDEMLYTPIIITNWETLYHTDEPFRVDWSAVIGDEAHRLKNRKSQIVDLTKNLNAKHVVLLSATFVQDLPDDWYAPLNVIRPDLFTSYWRFSGLFNVYEYDYAAQVQVPVAPKNVDILRDWAGPFVLQRKADEVANMPEKLYETYVCDMEEWHREFYDTVENEVLLELSDGSYLNVTNAMTKLLRLRQAAIHPGMLDPEYWKREIFTGKLDMLAELVNNSIPEDDQVIVYSSFIYGCESAAKAIGVNQCVIYAGDHADESDLKAFQDGSKRVFCATPGKGGVGLNLYNANYVIYLDSPLSSIELRQSEERVRAVGKTGPVYVVRLVARNTVDSYIEKLLADKLEHVTATEILQSYFNL